MLALLAIVVLVVALPYWINRASTAAAIEAQSWVAHSEEVRASAYQLTSQVRDMEAAVYALLQTGANSDIKQRLAESRTQIEPLLAELRGLTVDNPDQQVRLGSLTTVINQRVGLMDAALAAHAAGDDAAAWQDMAEAERRYRYRHIADTIVNNERQLLEQRGEIAAHKASIERWVYAGITLAQLLLLATVVVVSERQTVRRLRAETAARGAVERSRRIVQTVREPMVVLDADLCVLMVNPAFIELYGGDETMEQRHSSLRDIGVGIWDDEPFLQRLTDVIRRNRELWDYRLNQTTADGVERHMLMNARRMELPGTTAPALLLTVNDDTARTLADNQIIALNRQLEGKIEQVSDINRELEAFSYSVSHDLRAPLRHIAGFSEKLIVHLGGDIDRNTRHYLEVIGQAAQRMAQSIDDLLVYSRLGRGALRLAPVDMQSLVEQARALVMSEVRERTIEWQVMPLPVVVGDDNMLRTVWQNVLENAVKYTSGRDPAKINISVRRNRRGDYEFSVADNGAGFDMRYVDKLFGVFQRLHKASEFPGSGIGLASVRRIIGRHGGRVWAEGELGRGATFHFSLPASPDAAT